MFALKARNETASTRSVVHFSSAIVNIFLFLALVITSCVPAQATTPTPRKIDGATAVAQPSPAESESSPTLPVLTHSQPRSGEHAPFTLQRPNESASLSRTQDLGWWDKEVSSWSKNLEVASDLPAGKPWFKTFKPAPNPVRTVTKVRKSVSVNGVFTVTTLADTDDGLCDRHCSLREAIYGANDEPGENTITFNVSGKVILDTALPYSLDPAGLTISGLGQTVTIARGPAGGGSYMPSKPALEGKSLTTLDSDCDIYSEGPLTIADQTLSGCAIFTTAELTILNSSLISASLYSAGAQIITDSTASEGTSIFSNTTLVITGSTFFEESAIYSGDTLRIENTSFVFSAIYSRYAMTIIDSTFSDNTALAGRATVSIEDGSFADSWIAVYEATTISGITSVTRSAFASDGTVTVSDGNLNISNTTFIGDISNNGTLISTNNTIINSEIIDVGELYLYNTILARNSTCNGPVTAGHHNLIEASENSACGLSNGTNGNLVVPDAGLSERRTSNGGSRPSYYYLLFGSPATDAGDNSVCAAEPVNNTSQNLVTRPEGSACDIGAYEGKPVVFPGSTLNGGQSKTNKTTVTADVDSDGNFSHIICTYECEGDPINTQTGAFSFTIADLSFPTAAGEMVFQRSYSSGAVSTAGVLGYGWTHNHDAHLIFPTDPGGLEGYVLFQSVLGNQYPFKIEANGSFAPTPGVIASLTKSTTTPIVYTLTSSQQEIFRFGENGRLTTRQDAQGHAFDYEYDTQGQLIKISADGGEHFIRINYDTPNQITVSDYASPRRQVTYIYNATGDLASVIDVLGHTWTYLYDSHHLTEIKDPDGKSMGTTVYDSQGRVDHQRDGEGNLIVRLVYNEDGTTTIYDAYDHPKEHQYNEQNIVTHTTDPVGRTEATTYNNKLRPTVITNNANQALQMEWSADGINLLSRLDPAGNQTDYYYDSLNNLTSVVDPRGFPTTYTYDGKLLTKVQDALDGETTYTYTPEGYLESVTAPMERTTSYTYDSFGRRISMTDPSGNTWHYTYDPLGRLIDTTDPQERVTHNEYNAAGKLIRVTQNYVPDRPQNYENQYNIVTKYEYDVRGNQIAVTDTYEHKTRYVYDKADRLIQAFDALEGITTNVYDEAGRLVSTFDPLRHETKYEYDAAGRLIKTINARGDPTGTTTFDLATNSSTVTDLLGRKTVFYYDELGRVIKVVDPLEKFTTTTYDKNGNVASRTDQLGRPTYYQYDALNRLIKTIDPNEGETETFYDASGNRIATEDPLDHRTTYTYDEFGRLITVKDPLQRTTQTEYDQYGRRAATVDAAGHRTTYTYDALDRVIAVTDDDGNTTRTAYDALGNVLVSKDAKGNPTTTTYDALYRPHTITDANEHTTINTYDAAGNLIEVEDPLGHHTYYTYDALNRRFMVHAPLEGYTFFNYDSLGNLYSVANPNGIFTTYEYDELNRQTAVILNDDWRPADEDTNVRYEFAYNAVGNRISVKDPNGKITTYGYDALNHLIEKKDPLENTWSYTYDLAGRRITATDAKHQTIHYIYDEADQLTGIDYPGTELDVTFGYDLDGQRISMTDSLGRTTWDYDDLHRVTSVTDAFEQTIGYDYDAVGNRTELTYPDGKTVTYGYDDINHLTSVQDWDQQTTEYGYNAVGQVASISRPNGVSSQYDYDDAGRLKELHHNLGMKSLASYKYEYDPAGNRTRAIELLQNPQHVSSLPETLPVSQRLAKLPDPSVADRYMVPNALAPDKALYNVAPRQANFNHLPLSFVPNVGQFDKDVQFQTSSLGGSIYFTSSEVVLALMNKKVKPKHQEDDSFSFSSDNSKVARIEYKNAEKNPIMEGVDLQPGVANFMIGSDKKNWVANVPMYGGIVYRDLYPGIDLTYVGAGDSLKSTFTVAPGVDPALIQWKHKGAGDVSLDAEGNLRVTLAAQKAEQTDTTLIEHTPVAWQEVNGQRVNVPVQYTVAKNGEVSFVFSQGFDVSLPLIIDPTLTYSTYLGNTGTDVGTAITTDADGNVYLTGYSWCGQFPTVNPIQAGGMGGSEVIISKLSADGSTLLYSTCVGGTGDDSGSSVALDSQGRIVVGGVTDSTDFPIVSGIGTYGGGTCTVDAPCQDTFVLALNADGSAIRYSTYLGGNGRDELGGIIVDANDNILTVGSTTSANFPTANAYDSTYSTGGTCSSSVPCYDITVTKIDPNLSGTGSILYGTYLGENNIDRGYALALDASGKVYLTGASASDGYPTTGNAMQSTRKGDKDIVISVIDPGLSNAASLVYSTYFGSTGYEAAFGMARDGSGDIYLTGRTSSSKFPLRDPLQFTPHPGTCDVNCYEAFITKLDLSTNSLIYSTYLGGSENDAGNGIVVDSYGRAYVAGYTRSSDFPVSDPIQATKGADSCNTPPCEDAFLTVLEPDGQAYAYSTYLGGDQVDIANGIAIDSANNIYLVGETFSSNFPTTPGAYDLGNTDSQVRRDAFISKVEALSAPPQPTSNHLDVPLSASSDDAEETASGSSVSLTSTTLELTQATTNQKVGIRFAGVNLPQGAIIQNAWVQFTANGANSDVTNLTIQAEASDNAPTFVASANNISARLKTTASVSWTPASWNIVDEGGPDQRTPNLASVIQEVVNNRPGWASGNALAFIITGTANSKRVAKSYDRDVYGAPYLHIEYTLPVTGQLGLQITPNPTTFTSAGQTIVYTYTLTNTGTIPLSGPYVVSDDKVASVDCSSATSPLAVGASTSCIGSYTTTVTDVAAGSMLNAATAAASDGIGMVTSNAATATVNLEIPTGPLTIDYTYDALNRLTGATYSDGRSFGYTYDPAGNVLKLQKNLGPGTVVTTYTYDDANQVETATENGVTWQYDYDENGSLIETLPNGNATSGAKRYTYNVAGYLTQAEEHDGSDWNTQAEMDYNGLGQRLSMNAADVIAHYVMDGDQPLMAESGGNTTFYLYGLGSIGEKTTAWNYSLPDGMNTSRQLSDAAGAITLSTRYTPWGNTLDLNGTGNFDFGYFGGFMDAATGLLYVGNGQYYDPTTGRFLTRNAKPNSSNPYAPWDPTGAILGPLVAMALFFGKRKKGNKWGVLLVLLLVMTTVSMTLAACGGKPTEVQAVITPDGTATITFGPNTVVTTVAAATEAANIDITAIPCLTPLENVPAPTQTSTPMPTAPVPSQTCTGDCYDAYLTYQEVVNQLVRIPSIEEVLYMTAETEYTAYNDAVGFGKEGLARTYYSVCYVKDYINGCQGDELYVFLSGYEPWSDRSGVDRNRKTPAERAQHLVKTLGSNKDWLWKDMKQITNFDVANQLGWTQGRVGDKPWQWFGPFAPSPQCSKNVKPSKSIDCGNGFYFWMLTSDQTNAFNLYCP